MTTILREARIVMPAAHALPGKEHEASIAHERLRRALCDTFGGYTSKRGAGGWVAPDGTGVTEAVLIYDVAVSTTAFDGSSAKLARIALRAGRALGQHSVYIRYAHGVVAILEVDKAEEELSRGGSIPSDEVGKPEPRKRPHDAAVGDIWETRDGSIVAVIRFQGAGDQYLSVSVLRKGREVAVGAGGVVSYLRSRNGAFAYARGVEHPLDLVKLHSTF